MTFPIPSGVDSVARIIDDLLHPDFNKLGLYLDYHGPYTGNHTLTQWSLTPGPIFTDYAVSDSFGVMVQINGAIPPGWGFVSGWTTTDGLYDDARYTPPFGTLVMQRQMADGGWATTQRATLDRFPMLVQWQLAVPGRLGLLCAPNIALDLLYMHWHVPL